MRQLIVKQLDYDLTPVAGLALVGHYLKAMQPLLGRLAMIDALTSRQHEIPIRPASAATRAVRA